MPTSTWVHITDMVEVMMSAYPESVLDVGVGNGKWGFLTREYRDVFHNRVDPSEWKTEIIGIEPCARYIGDAQRAVYSGIYPMTFLGYVKLHPDERFDMIIMGDVLEHMTKEEGREALIAAKRMAIKVLVVCLPVGEGWEQGAWGGNEYETHKAKWCMEDLKEIGTLHKMYQVNGKTYAVILDFPRMVSIKLPPGWIETP